MFIVALAENDMSHGSPVLGIYDIKEKARLMASEYAVKYPNKKVYLFVRESTYRFDTEACVSIF